MIANILSDAGERNSRIYNFPTSAIKVNDRKLSYFGYLTGADIDPDCQKALLEIYEKIDLEQIFHVIDSVEVIDDLQKEFYKTMISERYKKILMPAYKKAKNNVIDNDKSQDFTRSPLSMI